MYEMGSERVLYNYLVRQNIDEDHPLIIKDKEIGEKIGRKRATVSNYKRVLTRAGLIKYSRVQTKNGAICKYYLIRQPGYTTKEAFEREAEI